MTNQVKQMSAMNTGSENTNASVAAAEKLLLQAKEVQDSTNKQLVIATEAKKNKIMDSIGTPMAVKQSQDALRAALSLDQETRDLKAVSDPESIKKNKVTFEPAEILERQVQAQAEQISKVKQMDLSVPEDDEEFTLVHPNYWTEMNPEKSLCNFKCELQPVVMGGVGGFLPVRNLKTSAAEKFLK
jgi:hypothetical protein